MDQRSCGFWLPNKRRFCANAPLSDSNFCGNHNPLPDDERVPCPVDPSHLVLKRNLESHIKRCPLRKQVADLESLPFYRKGINSGSSTSCSKKRSAISRLTFPEFNALVRKIKSLHSSIAMEIRNSYSIPDVCSDWMKQMCARKLPFQERHALQQASILGNLEGLGVLGGSGGSSDNEMCVPAVVEFGAGRGYLAHMLADCYGSRKVFLVDRRSYRLKADRSLRQNKNITIERLRINIEDLDLNAVENLKKVSYLAIGKHVCGPATDLLLRCCLPGRYGESRSDISYFLKGLAVSTCCHHHCQWGHYINKKLFEDRGITEDDFHAIAWFSSWAVDADHSSDLSTSIDEEDSQKIEMDQSEIEDNDVGAAIGSMKAVERAVFGFLCKEIIDIGRLLWLREQGLDAYLVKYVPRTISPENNLLVARRGTTFIH